MAAAQADPPPRHLVEAGRASATARKPNKGDAGRAQPHRRPRGRLCEAVDRLNEALKGSDRIPDRAKEGLRGVMVAPHRRSASAGAPSPRSSAARACTRGPAADVAPRPPRPPRSRPPRPTRPRGAPPPEPRRACRAGARVVPAWSRAPPSPRAGHCPARRRPARRRGRRRARPARLSVDVVGALALGGAARADGARTGGAARARARSRRQLGARAAACRAVDAANFSLPASRRSAPSGARPPPRGGAHPGGVAGRLLHAVRERSSVVVPPVPPDHSGSPATRAPRPWVGARRRVGRRA